MSWDNQINLDSYLEEVCQERYIRGVYGGDVRHNLGVGLVLELSDYDHGIHNVHIPFGPGWTAQQIDDVLSKKVRHGLVDHLLSS